MREGDVQVAGGAGSVAGGDGLLTVAVVVFNGGRSLEDTIESVIRLERASIRLVIIDGGSTDGTIDIIRRHEASLHYWVSEPDRGIYDAMNKAWAAAAPESSILFLGSGDKLLSLPAVFDNRHIYYGNVYIGAELFASNLRRGLKFGNTIHHQALMIPKFLHPEPPFDTRFRVYADFDLNQRLLACGHGFVYLPDLVSYALPGGVSTELDVEELTAVIRKNHGWFLAAFTGFFLKMRKVLSRLWARSAVSRGAA